MQKGPTPCLKGVTEKLENPQPPSTLKAWPREARSNLCVASKGRSRKIFTFRDVQRQDRLPGKRGDGHHPPALRHRLGAYLVHRCKELLGLAIPPALGSCELVLRSQETRDLPPTLPQTALGTLSKLFQSPGSHFSPLLN